LKAQVEEEQTRARSTYAEKEGVERIKDRRNAGRAIGGRGKMWRSRVGGKGWRMIQFESASIQKTFLCCFMV